MFDFMMCYNKFWVTIKMEKLKFKIADFIIIALIFVWGISGFWFNIQKADAAERKYATIYVENKQVAEISLAPGESYDYTFQFGNNNQHTARLEIEDGKIRMLPLGEELCPNAICSHTGWINYDYESIVCLPNRIMIVFTEVSGVEDEGIDGVTF